MDWITLEAADFNLQPDRKKVHGVAVTVGLSPFDIPDAIRGRYDRELERFVIEFSYLDGDEKRLPSWQSEHLTLYVGERTGCIYEIQIDVESLKAGAVALKVQIQEAIGELSTSDRFAGRRRNYELISEAVTRHADELLAEAT